MRVILRPTVAEDLPHVTSEDLPHRIRAITALIHADPSRTTLGDGSVCGDKVLAIGGIGYRGDGTVVAFMAANPEFRKYPRAIHRAGIMGMKLIRDSGVKLVLAEAQEGNAAAEPWLLRFGFRPVETGGHRAFVWERS